MYRHEIDRARKIVSEFSMIVGVDMSNIEKDTMINIEKSASRISKLDKKAKKAVEDAVEAESTKAEIEKSIEDKNKQE